jgi:hypothetical protein
MATWAERRRHENYRDALLAALSRDVEARDLRKKGDEASLARATQLETAAKAIRQLAEGHLMPTIEEEIGSTITELTTGAQAHLDELASLSADDGRDPVWKERRKAEIAASVDPLLNAARERAIETLTKAQRAANTLRFDPGEPAEIQRTEDTVRAELASRIHRPAGRIEADLMQCLEIGNYRGASQHLMTLQFMNEATDARFQVLGQRIEAGLDEVLPHRKAAVAIERSAAAAQRDYLIAAATAKAKLEAALGHGPEAAHASMVAKQARWAKAQAEGVPYKGLAAPADVPPPADDKVQRVPSGRGPYGVAGTQE